MCLRSGMLRLRSHLRWRVQERDKCGQFTVDLDLVSMFLNYSADAIPFVLLDSDIERVVLVCRRL
jgi:hypothetical protein